MRFADDVLIFAASRAQLQRMLTDLMKFSGDEGLEMHADKTKILTNKINANRSHVQVGERRVEVLEQGGGVKYLGRWLTLCAHHHDRELDHRIQCAWGKFAQWKNELCSRHYPLKDRLRLFDSTIKPTVLYGSKAWVMTSDREKS